MNHEQVKKDLQEKLSESKVHSLMSEFFEQVQHYPAALPELIDHLKKKQFDALAVASNTMYPYHSNFSSSFNDYSSSVILICSERAVPYMVSEVATFVYYMEVFYKQTEKMKQNQGLYAYYKTFKVKPKMIIDAMFEDLKFYSEKFDFELDLVQCKEVLKQTKSELKQT